MTKLTNPDQRRSLAPRLASLRPLARRRAHGGTMGWLADDGQPLEDALPSLAAGAVASLAGWILDDLFQPYLGVGVTLVLSLVASTWIFFYVRRWLVELRGK